MPTGVAIAAGVAGLGLGVAGAATEDQPKVKFRGPRIAGKKFRVFENQADRITEIERQLGLGTGEVGLEAGRQFLFGTEDAPGVLDSIFDISGRLDSLSEQEQFDLTAERIQRFREADPILGLLSGQIEDDLALGGELDPSTRREVQQAVRSGQAARGFGFGGGDLFEEILATGTAAENRRQRRQMNALRFLSSPADLTQRAAAGTVAGPLQQFALSQGLAGSGFLGPFGQGLRVTESSLFSPQGGAFMNTPNNDTSNALSAGGAGLMSLAGGFLSGGGGNRGNTQPTTNTGMQFSIF